MRTIATSLFPALLLLLTGLQAGAYVEGQYHVERGGAQVAEMNLLRAGRCRIEKLPLREPDYGAYYQEYSAGFPIARRTSFTSQGMIWWSRVHGVIIQPQRTTSTTEAYRIATEPDQEPSRVLSSCENTRAEFVMACQATPGCVVLGE